MPLLWNTKRKEIFYNKNRWIIDRKCDDCGNIKTVTTDNVRKVKTSKCVKCAFKPRWNGGYVNCKECGKKFWVRKCRLDRTKYCSKKCQKSTWQKKVVDCLNCNKSMEIRVKQKTKYCSKECYYSHGKVDRYCQECSQKIIGDGKKYCSHKCANRGINNPAYGLERPDAAIRMKKWWTNQDNRSSHMERMIKNNPIIKMKRYPTSLETYLSQYFNKNGVKHRLNQIVEGREVDILLDGCSIIVECDGKYWHNLPKAKEQDERKNEYFTGLGYTLLRFKEDEIRENPALCLKKVQEVLYAVPRN